MNLTCSCFLLYSLLDSPSLQFTPHYSVRPYEFIQPVRKILETNSTNIPIPTTSFIKKQLSESLQSLYYQLKSFISLNISEEYLYTIPHIQHILQFINTIEISTLNTSNSIPTIDEIEQLKVTIRELRSQLDEKELMRQHDLHVVTTDKETEIFQLKNLVKELRQTLEAQQMQTEKKLNEVENKLASDIRSYKKIIQELREKLENNLHESK